jgi:membrane-associated protease RseP (regulator of RpoE activity)
MKEFLVFILLLAATVAGYSSSGVPVLYKNIDLTGFLLFVIVIGFLIYRDRKKVRLESIVFIRRTQKGRNFIDKTAKANPRFWRIVGVAGVVVAVPLLVLGSLFLIMQASSVVAGEAGGVKLLLPGPVSAPTDMPGIFVVPWWIWIVGVAIVIIPHEFMHGIMCRLDKIRIKSVGWILLVIIPGAFVEPDEKQLQKAKRNTKLRVYAAGSFANIVVAMIALVIMAFYFSSSFTAAGTYVLPINNTPAYTAGISGTITSIAGEPVRSMDDIREILGKYNPGNTIEVRTVAGDIVGPKFQLSGWDFFVPKHIAISNTTEEKAFSATLTKHPERDGAFLGITPLFETYHYTGQDFQAYQTIITLLMWIYIFNLGIGIINILPIKPLDGGLVFEELVGKRKWQKEIVRTVSIVMLFVLLFNLLGPIFL